MANLIEESCRGHELLPHILERDASHTEETLTISGIEHGYALSLPCHLRLGAGQGVER